jgi:hypothetical protein
MEWHADGGAGEATVLLSLADVADAQGALGIVPASHTRYNTQKAAAGGACGAAAHGAAADVASEADASDAEEEEEDQAARVMAGCAPPVWYAYRAGVPALLDARTLHAAADNVSGDLRAVAWFIYNQDDNEDANEDTNEDTAEVEEAQQALAGLSVGA